MATYLFLGMENQYSGRSLFLPYDITVVGKGVDFPNCLPILKRKYIGGSWQARAGLGINSVELKCCNFRIRTLTFKKFILTIKAYKKCRHIINRDHRPIIKFWCWRLLRLTEL
jgi:hypothetical protein